MSNRAVFGHVIAAGQANTAPYFRLIHSLRATYGWMNIYIIYDKEGLDVFAIGAKKIHAAIRSYNFISTLKTISSNHEESYDEVLADFRTTARSTWG